MVADVLGDQKQIGLVLLQPGWEADYYGAAEVFKTGSMGLIAEHSQLQEGKYDILLRGQSRFQIVDFTCQKPYRIARVRLVEDVVPNDQEVKELAVELASLFQEVSAVVVPPDWGLDVVEKLDFASLVNSVCSATNLSIYKKQQLLEMDYLQVRAETVLSVLRQQVKSKRFISRFSHLKPEDPTVN